MWLLYVSLIVISIVSCNGVTVIPEFLTQCSSIDTKCIADLWTTTVHNLADGRPDLNVPKLDPLSMKDFNADIPGVANVEFNGTVKGIRKCVFDTSRAHFEKEKLTDELDLRCNLTIKGRYNIIINSSALFGGIANNGINGLIKANGEGKVKLVNVNMKLLMDLKIIRDEDNEIILVLKDGPIGSKYKIDGPVVFAGNNIFFADQDISTFVIGFINQNWQAVIDVFGKPFFVKAMEVMGDHIRAFFKVVPARALFSDDLSQYAPEAN